MEFNQKLQNLRKQKGITQEQLAEELFVSRTAVSKWESGRGYPSIDSLKAISKYFSVTVDDLLSGDELICIAEEDNQQKTNHMRSLVFALLDISCFVLLFVPVFADRSGGAIREVSLLSLSGDRSYLRLAYYSIVIISILLGFLALVMQNCSNAHWSKIQCSLSLALNIFATVLFILSLQPYAAVLLFIFLIIKLFLIIKKQ